MSGSSYVHQSSVQSHHSPLWISMLSGTGFTVSALIALLQTIT